MGQKRLAIRQVGGGAGAAGNNGQRVVLDHNRLGHGIMVREYNRAKE